MGKSKMTVLGIDSSSGSLTKSLRDYREVNVYPYLIFKGQVVSKCQDATANRRCVAPKAKSHGVVFITGSGHGDDDSFDGQTGPVFDFGAYDPKEVDGKIVHLLACSAAVKLGRDFVKKGCSAFFGYGSDLLFYPDVHDVFCECDSEIDRAFADGLTAVEVFDRVKKLVDQRADELLDDNIEESVENKASLLEMFACLRCPSQLDGKPVGTFGNEMARLA
jgi:hypothetical protein